MFSPLPTTPSRRRLRVQTSLLVSGLVLALPLLALVAARPLPLDLSPEVVALEAFTFPVMAAALVGAALVAASHRRWTAVAVAALVGAQVLLLAASPGGPFPYTPLSPPRDSVAPPSASVGAPLRLVSANVFEGNPDTSRVASALRAADADVVLLMEYNPRTRVALDADGILASYPHSVVDPAGGSNGIGLWSRYPLEGAEVLQVNGRPLVRATLLVGDRRVLFVGVHPVAPLDPAETLKWDAVLGRAAELVGASRDPVVVAGDFNASSAHAPFRRLAAAGGLGDVHALLGHRFVRTWPLGHRFAPPVLHLDHVLVSEEVLPVALEEVDGTGSDHVMLVVDLSL